MSFKVHLRRSAPRPHTWADTYGSPVHAFGVRHATGCRARKLQLLAEPGLVREQSVIEKRIAWTLPRGLRGPGFRIEWVAFVECSR